MGSFGKGDRVFQRQYGVGDVVAVDDRYMTIQFDNGIVRKFLTTLVQLQPTNEPRPVQSTAPKRGRRRRQTDVEASGGAEGKGCDAETRQVSIAHVD